MTTYLLIGLATVLFIAGVALLLKGASVEELKVEPISNPKEIMELKNVFGSPRETASLSGELKLKQELESRAESQLKKMADQDNAQRQKMNELQRENTHLKEQLEERKIKFLQSEENMAVLKKEYAQLKTSEKEAVSEDLKLPDELKQKSEQWEKQHAELQGRLSEVNLAAAKSRFEQDELLAQIKKSEEHVAALNQQMQAAQKTHDDKIKEADQALEELRSRKSDASRMELVSLSDKLTTAIAALETLKRENQELAQRNANLERNFKQVEEFNVHLREKERTLQYELMKNRAQSLGLEKICEGFKVQIETMAAASSVE